MIDKLGQLSPADDTDHIEVAAIDGPSQPLEIHTPPPGTKRLSKKGQFLLLGVASAVASAILIGVMISGKSGSSAESKKQLTASDAPGQTAPYKENAEDIQRRTTIAAAAIGNQAALQMTDGQQTGPLTSRSSNPKNSSGGTQTASGGAAPPSPAEAHRLWLQKRRYERIQGLILASDSAETADISKGGAALAARSAAAGVMGLNAKSESLGEDVGSGVNQRLSAASGRAENARATATAAAMRTANSPSGAAGTSSNSGNLPATLAAGSAAGLDPAVTSQARNKAFMKEAADNGYLPEPIKPNMGEFELTAGSVIPAVMLSGINSDLPGTIMAQTRQTVYATNDPDTVVIPQGSRLIGRYSADVAYGQSRVLAAWDELILPNGSRIALRGMSAADAQGQSGMEDQV